MAVRKSHCSGFPTLSDGVICWSIWRLASCWIKGPWASNASIPQNSNSSILDRAFGRVQDLKLWIQAMKNWEVWIHGTYPMETLSMSSNVLPNHPIRSLLKCAFSGSALVILLSSGVHRGSSADRPSWSQPIRV